MVARNTIADHQFNMSSLKYIFIFTTILLMTTTSYAQSGGECRGGSYELVKPFLGNWKEYNVTESGEEFIGTLRSKLNLNGCVISQRFVSSDSSFSYLSFGYIEPSSNIWQETYVFNNGSVSKFEWLVDGNDVLQRRIGGTRKMEYMHQLRLTNISKDFYDVIEEHSYDGGKTWERVELTRIERIE